jgi:hypothetical protein
MQGSWCKDNLKTPQHPRRPLVLFKQRLLWIRNVLLTPSPPPAYPQQRLLWMLQTPSPPPHGLSSSPAFSRLLTPSPPSHGSFRAPHSSLPHSSATLKSRFLLAPLVITIHNVPFVSCDITHLTDVSHSCSPASLSPAPCHRRFPSKLRPPSPSKLPSLSPRMSSPARARVAPNGQRREGGSGQGNETRVQMSEGDTGPSSDSTHRKSDLESGGGRNLRVRVTLQVIT